MSVTPNTTTTENFNIDAKVKDFVERFNMNWDALREIMGVMRPIRKTPGTRLKSYKVEITRGGGQPAEGDEVELSQANVTEVAHKDLSLTADRMRITAQDVEKYGAPIAVRKTTEAFLNKIQGDVMDEFYEFAMTGSLTGTETDFQMAVSMAVARVKDKFKKMKLNYGNVVVFVNTLDAGRYNGAVGITTQTLNGIEYLKNVLGAETMIISSEIPEGTVVAIPADNIVLYYIDPADSEFKELGLNYYTGDGETNLIGAAREGVYGRLSGDIHILYGLTMWAEYLDAIAVVTVETSGSMGSISGFSTAAGSAVGKSVLTVPDPSVGGGKYYFKSQASTAPSAPTYLDQFDTTGWTEVVDDQEVTATNGHKYRVVEVNGAGQAIATADGTVVAKAS